MVNFKKNYFLDFGRDAIVIYFFCYLAIFTALFVYGISGNFPENDDFIYALSVKSLLETGRFTLPIPSSPNAIVHVYWGALFCAPFGFSFTALRLSTAVLAPIGVVATYQLLSEIGVPRRLRLAGALCIACNPVYVSQSVTFMTDVPFTVAFTVALWLYARCLVRDSFAAFVGGAVVALIAVFIRQFALVEMAAFALAYSVRRRWHFQAVLAGAISLALGIMLHVVYSRWIIATGRMPALIVPLEQILPTDIGAFLKRSLHITVNSTPFLAACMLPVFVLLVPRRPSLAWFGWRTSLSRVLFIMLAAGALVIISNLGEMMPKPGNILMPWGIGPMVLRDTTLLGINDPEVPWVVSVLWAGLTVVAVLVASMLALRIGAMTASLLRVVAGGGGAERSVEILMLMTICGYMLIVFALGHRSNFFDRYLLPLIPPLMVLAIRAFGVPDLSAGSYRTGWMVLAGGMLMIGLVYSAAGTHDHIAWQRARWEAADRLAAAGITPAQIDGGWEYNGWLNHPSGEPLHPGVSYWYVTDDLYMITNGPVPGYEEAMRVPVDRWIPFGPSAVHVLRRVGEHATSG